MTKVLHYLWQLPQDLLGFIILLVLRRRVVGSRAEKDVVVWYCFRVNGGVSLGRYVFVHREAGNELVLHELGHCRQSLLLGPFYLFVIGIPSFLWAALFPLLSKRWPRLDYFQFYTESWANRLAGVRLSSIARERTEGND